MTLEQEMAYALMEIKNYFSAEKLMVRAYSIDTQYLAAKMMFRKAMDIFPELNTRPSYQEVIPTLQQSRLVKE